MFRTKDNSFNDGSINPASLAEYEFRTSPVLLCQSLINGLLIIKLSSRVDYTIAHHLWLPNYLKVSMVLLGAERAVSFLTTDIDECIKLFSEALGTMDLSF
jgi:hypothetical protein